MARALLTDGGIAYSASKKKFLVLLSWNEEGNGAGKRIDIVGGDDKREIVKICEAVECDEKATELTETLGPKLAARLRDGGFVPVKRIAWPDEKDQMDVPDLGITLKFRKDHLEIAGGKKPVILGKIKFSRPHQASPTSIAISPDKSLFAVELVFDPGSQYAAGFNVYTEVHVYPAP